MSNPLAAHKQPSDPNKKEPDDEKKQIKIPAWWSIVALIMAGLVVLPIQYANLHEKKNVAPAEAEVKPNAPEAASPAKEDAGPAETQATRTAEQPGAQPKPGTADAGSPAKDDVGPAKTQVARAEEQAAAQPKPDPAEAAPPAKEDSGAAETPVARTEPAEAQPKPVTAETAPRGKTGHPAPAETQAKEAVSPKRKRRLNPVSPRQRPRRSKLNSLRRK